MDPINLESISYMYIVIITSDCYLPNWVLIERDYPAFYLFMDQFPKVGARQKVC